MILLDITSFPGSIGVGANPAGLVLGRTADLMKFIVDVLQNGRRAYYNRTTSKVFPTPLSSPDLVQYPNLFTHVIEKEDLVL